MAIRDVEFYGKRSIPDARQMLATHTKEAKDVIADIGPSGPPATTNIQGLSDIGKALLGYRVAGLSGKREDAALASLDAREKEKREGMLRVFQAATPTRATGQPSLSAQTPVLRQPGQEPIESLAPLPAKDYTPANPGGRAGMIAMLNKENNPDLYSFQLDLMNQQVAERERAAAAKLARTQDMEDFRTKQEIEAEFRDPEIDKYGTSFVVADPNSSTGFSRQRKNQGGKVDILGEAPAPKALFDPDAQQKTAKFKATSARYDKATDNVTEADKVIIDVQSMLNLVGKVDSGSFAETKLALKKFALAVGFDMDLAGIANAETMKSKGMDFVLQRISRTKGAISEKEMKAFKEASAGIENTAAGNRMILALAQKVATRLKFSSEAVRDAWGKDPSISVYDLDNVEIKAREEWDKKFGGMSVNAEIVKIRNDADWKEFNNDPNIPSGTAFIDPDGSKRFKK